MSGLIEVRQSESINEEHRVAQLSLPSKRVSLCWHRLFRLLNIVVRLETVVAKLIPLITFVFLHLGDCDGVGSELNCIVDGVHFVFLVNSLPHHSLVNAVEKKLKDLITHDEAFWHYVEAHLDWVVN